MTDSITNRARKLRQQQTKAESLLWTALQARQLSGLKFRRQHPIGPFFADFVCIDRRLIVEIDGGYHNYQYEDDASRQRYLENNGWSVLRFANEDVLADVESVVIAIARNLGVTPVFGRRKSERTGMYDAQSPSLGPLARPLPKGEVTDTKQNDET